MIEALLEGFGLGLATGSVCLFTCTPIYLPFLMSEERKLGSSLLAVLEISAGRFFSYLTFGALAGLLGASISGVNRDVFTAIAYVLLSVYLVLTAVRTRRSDHKCSVPKWMGLTKSGFLLGVFTGINFCPAFLIALSNAIHLAGALQGMMLFFGFFVGTSLFLIPLAFAGLLTRMRHLKSIARAAAVIIAVWFIGKGAWLMWNVAHPSAGGFAKPVAVAWAEPNADYFANLADSLQLLSDTPVRRLAPGSAPDSDSYIWFADNTLAPEPFEGLDVIPVEPGYGISVIMQTLRTGVESCPEEEASDNPLCATCPTLTGGAATNLRFETPQGRIVDAFAPKQPLAVVSSRKQWRYFEALTDSLQSRSTGEVTLHSADDDSLPASVIFIDRDVWAADSTRYSNYDRFIVDPGYPMATLVRHAAMFTFRTDDHVQWSYRND